MENRKIMKNKDLDGTVYALGILATQRQTGLLNFIVNQNPEVISYLNNIGNKSFASFLSNFVEDKNIQNSAKTNSYSREM